MLRWMRWYELYNRSTTWLFPLHVSWNKSGVFGNKENGAHMFNPVSFPWQLCFYLRYVYTSLFTPSTDQKSLGQMSTKHFDTGLVPNMTDSLLDFGLALSFSIALFFSPCLLTTYYAAASVFCDVPSCFWPSSTTLLKNVEYLHWPSCSNEAFSMCLMSSQCWHSISVSRSQKTLITRISKLPKIYPPALTKCSSELESMFGQSTANAS